MSHNNRPRQSFSHLGVERLEAREVPAVVTHVVNTPLDLPDSDLSDNIPMAVAPTDKVRHPLVSLRSVMEQMNATGNGNDTYRVEFDLQSAPSMTIALESQLPAIANRHYQIVGSSDRAVTLTRDLNADATSHYRFLNVLAGGKLEVNGIKLTQADNRGSVGGAIFNSGGILTVVNCYFGGNVGKDGGAIANLGSLTVTGAANGGAKSEFSGNTSEGFGGAIYTGGAGPVPVADIQNTLFTDNVAGDTPGRLGTHKGGAIATNLGGFLSIAGCTFTANKAQDGGAMYADGPSSINPNLLVSDSKFESNHAHGLRGNGGAAWIKELNAKFTTCQINSNQSDNEGGGIFQDAGKLDLVTCMFAGNVALGSWDGRFADDVANFVGLGNPTTVTLFGTVVTVVVW